MSEFYCSTGALLVRSNNRDYRLLRSFAKEIECDGFEFMIYGMWYSEMNELRRTISAMHLNIPVVHCDKQLGEGFTEGGEASAEAVRRFRENCITAQCLGAKKAVLHLWNGIPSDRNFRNNLEVYPVLLEIAEQYSLELLVENVVCNCADPMTRWIQLKERFPGARFVYDTKMAAFHDQSNIIYSKAMAWLRESKAIRHYHVNDYGGEPKEWTALRTLPVGAGKIDFEPFFAYIRNIGEPCSFTTESTAVNAEGYADTEMLNRQFALLRSRIG